MSVNSNQLLLVVLLIAAVAAAKTIPMSKPNCPSKCGNVTIPFPFGLTNPCSLNTSFLITCDKSLPFLKTTTEMRLFNTTDEKVQVQVLDISLDGQLHVSLPVATSCVDNKNVESDNDYSFFIRLYTPFHLSSKQNKLTVLGAYTAGIVADDYLRSQTTYAPTYCVSFYSSDLYNKTHDESCSGTFCCETPIQHRLSEFYYACAANIFDYNSTRREFLSYPCGYTFLAKEGAYNFSMRDFINFNRSNTFPVVVDWAVGNTCLDAQKNASSYACKSKHSECHNAEVGPGYHCKCSTGFRGNPYLSDGCQDVDECVEESHDCLKGRSTCINSPEGSYSCSCLKGYEGGGKNNGSGCVIRSNRKIIIALIIPKIVNHRNPKIEFYDTVGLTRNRYRLGAGRNHNILNTKLDLSEIHT
ncbi:Wall-associated receptor [Vigna angularis]|uniref:Wall-associated receptor n=1 Tax=Phaseolus angularis TaxID=3914 RepID=A0A8T0KL46_PHAAN|nr:Wall-associated receptor [Vigna angularis]